MLVIIYYYYLLSWLRLPWFSAVGMMYRLAEKVHWKRDRWQVSWSWVLKKYKVFFIYCRNSCTSNSSISLTRRWDYAASSYSMNIIYSTSQQRKVPHFSWYHSGGFRYLSEGLVCTHVQPATETILQKIIYHIAEYCKLIPCRHTILH